MIRLYWLSKLVGNIIALGWINRNPMLSLGLLGLIALGLLFTAAQVSAPFIYTLF